jgi:hypothetical protein
VQQDQSLQEMAEEVIMRQAKALANSELRLYGVLGSALRKYLLQLYLLSREPFTLWQDCYLPPH